MPSILFFLTFHTESGVDYFAVVNEPLIFGAGDNHVCHNIEIVNDDLCELSPIEFFSTFLEYENSQTPIIFSPNSAHVIINDTRECGKSRSLSYFGAITYFTYNSA